MFYRRGWIAVFLFTLTMINYMDRLALSMAAKPIAGEFHLSPVGIGYLFSSYTWSYTILLIPMGLLIDRLGTKRMAGSGILIWSAATISTALASTLGGLIGSRLVMGAGESTTNPVASKVIRQWIPANERGVITAIFNSGSYAGPAICAILLGWLIGWQGWRAAFIVAGVIGFVWLVIWMAFFNVPEKVRWLRDQERGKIIAERNGRDASIESQPARGLWALMRTRTLWGLLITQGCNAYTQYLFLTWLPSYLQSIRHMSIATTGVFAAVPYASAVVICILAGRLSDRYLRGGTGAGRRRNAVALAMLVGALILAVPFASDMVVLIAVFSVALGGIASTSSLNYALLNDLLPNSRDVGKATAFIVTGGNVFGMMAPIVTGYVIAATGSYNWAFGIAGLLLLIGATVILTMTRRPIVADHGIPATQSFANK